MTGFSISRAWDQTRDVLARDGRLITSVALALILLPQAVAGVASPPRALSGVEPPSWMPLLMLLIALLGIVGQIALVRLALGPRISVGEAIAHGLRRLLPTFVALVLFGLAMALLMIPVVLALAGPEQLQAVGEGRPAPGALGAMLVAVAIVLLIGVRFQLMVPVATAEPVGPIRILKRSWALTRGHYWKLLGFILLVSVAAITVVVVAQLTGGVLGALFFGQVEPFTLGALLVALIVAAAQAAFVAVLSVMIARIYAQLAGASPAAASVPSSGT